MNKKENISVMLINNNWLEKCSLEEIIELARTSNPPYQAIYNTDTEKIVWDIWG